jgi:hypothetical protein
MPLSAITQQCTTITHPQCCHCLALLQPIHYTVTASRRSCSIACIGSNVRKDHESQHVLYLHSPSCWYRPLEPNASGVAVPRRNKDLGRLIGLRKAIHAEHASAITVYSTVQRAQTLLNVENGTDSTASQIHATSVRKLDESSAGVYYQWTGGQGARGTH